MREVLLVGGTGHSTWHTVEDDPPPTLEYTAIGKVTARTPDDNVILAVRSSCYRRQQAGALDGAERFVRVFYAADGLTQQDIDGLLRDAVLHWWVRAQPDTTGRSVL